MSPDEITRYRSKAATCAAAWQAALGEAPTRHALILAMAVADLETGLGNIRGHNWGSVHKRVPSDAESAILLGHGIFPTGNDALVAARGLLAPTQTPDELLVIDSSPTGPYFVWIWSFKNDFEAAKKFLTVLIGNRPAVRAVIDGASSNALATAMYATHYYEGNDKNPAENIRAYARLIDAHVTRIESALNGWPPGGPAARPTPPAADEKRPAVGWWLAGIAAVSLGFVFLGRRA